MQPKDYFIKTFSFVFVFYTVYKFTYQLFNGLDGFTTSFILKTLGVALVCALILGIINYFVKFDITKRKKL